MSTDEDHTLFTGALECGGIGAYGIAAVEIYMFLQHTPLLVRPKDVLWYNPDFIPKDKHAFERIVNKESSEYLEPPPQSPGVGLAGVLWVNSENDTAPKNYTSTMAKPKNVTLLSLSRKFNQSPIHKIEKCTNNNSKNSMTLSRLPANMTRSFLGGKWNENKIIKWRDIRSLYLDPDQPTDLRLKVLEKAGFAKVAGVRFDVCGHQGIVVYFTGEDVDDNTLQLPEYEAYLRNMGILLGASATLVKSRTSLSTRVAPKEKVEHLAIVSEKKCMHKMKEYCRKLKGGNLQPPPPMNFKETILTFFGVFIGLFFISGLSEAIKNASNGKYSIVMGPFGALMTLQYSLVMSPASQPRNVIFGQTFAICIAMVFTYLPTWVMPIWVRSSLATAVTIATISKLNIIHPPAAASSMIIAANDFDWMILPIMLLGNIVAIFIATLINNLSDNRHYPTFLYFGEKYVIDIYKMCSSIFQTRFQENETDPEIALVLHRQGNSKISEHRVSSHTYNVDASISSST